MSGILKKIVGQTAIYGLSSIVGRLLNYLLVPLFTRVFLPAEYGVVTELYAYAGFLSVLLTYGMETGYFRFASKSDIAETIFSTSFIALFTTTLLFLAFIFIFLSPIASILDYKKNPEYIIWFALIISVDVLSALPFAKLRLQNKAKKFALLKLTSIIINIALNLFFLVICKENNDNALNTFHIKELSRFYKPETGVGYIFISNLISNSITFIFFIPSIFKIKFILNKEVLKNILKYSLPLLIAGMAGMINEVFDRILLKYFLEIPQGAEQKTYIMSQIGIYGANYKLAILMTLFIQAFRYAAEPLFFSMQKNKDAKSNYAQIMNYFIIFGLIIFLGVMMYIDIAKLFIGEQYREGLNIVPILLLANLFLGIIFNLSFWYKLSDKTIYGTIISIIGAVITLILNILLIPKFGYLGSAWATFFCYFSMMIISWILGNKHYEIPYNFKKAFFYFALALLLYFISEYLKPANENMKFTINTIYILFFIINSLFVEKFHKKLLKK